jgi:hypothetical protein
MYYAQCTAIWPPTCTPLLAIESRPPEKEADMKKVKPPFKKYPGNDWFARQVERAGSESTVPFIHGVVRGALANPFAIDPGMALEEVFMDAEMIDFPQEEFEKLSFAFLLLWNDTARVLSSSRPFPEAISYGIRTGVDDSRLLSEAADLAEGFVRGFNLKAPPKGQRLPCARSWLKDVEGEGDWCRMMYENPDLLEKTLPGADHRGESLIDALGWIEECMGWTALYARADMDEAARPAGGGGSMSRKSPCPCGSGRKYKRCCGVKKTEMVN